MVSFALKSARMIPSPSNNWMWRTYFSQNMNVYIELCAKSQDVHKVSFNLILCFHWLWRIFSSWKRKNKYLMFVIRMPCYTGHTITWLGSSHRRKLNLLKLWIIYHTQLSSKTSELYWLGLFGMWNARNKMKIKNRYSNGKRNFGNWNDERFFPYYVVYLTLTICFIWALTADC